MSDAAQITRRAKSNLAFALRVLPRERRDDAVVFYAFCRTLDDLADEPGIPAKDRFAALNAWKNGLISGFEKPTPLQRQVVDLRERHGIPNELLTAIIDGCLMDLEPRRYQTRDELADYVWKVACAVGLVSIRIFGCTDLPAAQNYAVSLGRALQLTNILRDIREDYENGGRIYLPMEDLARFGCTEDDLATGARNEGFLALMEFETGQAEAFFQEAEAILPAADKHALAPARAMAAIYRKLLSKMREDGFRVFEKRYHLSLPEKMWILSRELMSS